MALPSEFAERKNHWDAVVLFGESGFGKLQFQLCLASQMRRRIAPRFRRCAASCPPGCDVFSACSRRTDAPNSLFWFR